MSVRGHVTDCKIEVSGPVHQHADPFLTALFGHIFNQDPRTVEAVVKVKLNLTEVDSEAVQDFIVKLRIHVQNMLQGVDVGLAIEELEGDIAQRDMLFKNMQEKAIARETVIKNLRAELEGKEAVLGTFRVANTQLGEQVVRLQKVIGNARKAADDLANVGFLEV